jgi:hypothetical protein
MAAHAKLALDEVERLERAAESFGLSLVVRHVGKYRADRVLGGNELARSAVRQMDALHKVWLPHHIRMRLLGILPEKALPSLVHFVQTAMSRLTDHFGKVRPFGHHDAMPKTINSWHRHCLRGGQTHTRRNGHFLPQALPPPLPSTARRPIQC